MSEMTKGSFLRALERIVVEVEQHPLLEIVTWQRGEPLTDETRRSIEETLRGPLPSAVGDLYSEANGWELHWRFREDLSDTKWDEISERYDDYFAEPGDTPGTPFARIKFIPLEDVVQTDWVAQLMPVAGEEERVLLEQKEIPETEFAEMLKPFDMYSDYVGAAYVVQPQAEEWEVVMLDEGYQDWRSSQRTDLDSYLRLLISTHGIAQARLNALRDAKKGTLKRITWDKGIPAAVKRTPKLFGGEEK
jgi:hypothetical protein